MDSSWAEIKAPSHPCSVSFINFIHWFFEFLIICPFCSSFCLPVSPLSHCAQLLWSVPLPQVEVWLSLRQDLLDGTEHLHSALHLPCLPETRTRWVQSAEPAPSVWCTTPAAATFTAGALSTTTSLWNSYHLVRDSLTPCCITAQPNSRCLNTEQLLPPSGSCPVVRWAGHHTLQMTAGSYCRELSPHHHHRKTEDLFSRNSFAAMKKMDKNKNKPFCNRFTWK